MVKIYGKRSHKNLSRTHFLLTIILLTGEIRAIECEVMKQLKITVTGRVQGVGFRQFTADAARSLGIHGQVRNMPDGSVECYARAEDDQMKKFIQKLKKGPALSRVDSVNPEPVQAHFEDTFEITF